MTPEKLARSNKDTIIKIFYTEEYFPTPTELSTILDVSEHSIKRYFQQLRLENHPIPKLGRCRNVFPIIRSYQQGQFGYQVKLLTGKYWAADIEEINEIKKHIISGMSLESAIKQYHDDCDQHKI